MPHNKQSENSTKNAGKNKFQFFKPIKTTQTLIREEQALRPPVTPSISDNTLYFDQKRFTFAQLADMNDKEFHLRVLIHFIDCPDKIKRKITDLRDQLKRTKHQRPHSRNNFLARPRSNNSSRSSSHASSERMEEDTSISPSL